MCHSPLPAGLVPCSVTEEQRCRSPRTRLWHAVVAGPGTGRSEDCTADGGCQTDAGQRAARLCVTAGACGTLNDVKNTFIGGGVSGPGSEVRRISGFIGGVVADEPTAALAGREVLAIGGNAADAAVAVGFTLAVTYPSRASLGSGGACLAYSPAKTGAGEGVPEAIVFTSVRAQNRPGRTDRPAAVPMLARGLFALHARYGRRPFETLIAPAEQLARFGTPASRAFVRDLQLVAGPLLADPDARAVFAPAAAC